MVKLISVCLLVLGVTSIGWIGLADETPSSVNPPRKVADAGDESGTSPDVPLVEVFSPKDKLKSKDERVRAQAYLSVDKLAAGSTCQVIVVVTIEKGWHINAEQPQPNFLIPVKIGLNSRNKLELVDVEYPPGNPFQFPGAAANVLVHEGEIQLRGTVQIPKDLGGLTEETEMTVRYQACNERGCLPPKTMTLIGKLPIAKPGDLVQPINRKLFSRRSH